MGMFGMLPSRSFVRDFDHGRNSSVRMWAFDSTGSLKMGSAAAAIEGSCEVARNLSIVA